MLPPLLPYAHIEFRSIAKTLPRNRSILDKLIYMPALTLSTGVKLLCEQVQRVEFYPRGSYRVSALVYAISEGRNGALDTNEKDFLCVHTINGKIHVRGSGAAKDAIALEEAGIQVYRGPKN